MKDRMIHHGEGGRCYKAHLGKRKSFSGVKIGLQGIPGKVK